MSARGFTYAVYTKLYNSLIWLVIEYGSAAWGLKSCPCINAVHNIYFYFLHMNEEHLNKQQ